MLNTKFPRQKKLKQAHYSQLHSMKGCSSKLILDRSTISDSNSEYSGFELLEQEDLINLAIQGEQQKMSQRVLKPV